MATHKRYLVIWHLGNNEQSKTETVVDLIIYERDHKAKDLINGIRNEIIRQESLDDNTAIDITFDGIFKL